MENLIKLNVIKDIVTKRLLFLENEEGYKVSSIIFKNLEKSELDKYSDLPRINIFYFNSKVNRQIQLDVTISNRPSFYIENTSIQDYFSHHDYFRYRYDKKIVFDDLEGQNSKEKLESFLKIIIKELKGSLHNVINGNEWIKVPEDWGPYK
jgi:hypothetical protein